MNRIYLDYQSTTPCDKRVVEKMIPYFYEKFGNPHSNTHSFGWEASEAVENARQQVANIIKANPKDIIFTSGATESNNLAIKGLCNILAKSGKKHIITSTIDHKCVIETCRYMQLDHGFEITYLHVDKNGFIDPVDIKNAIKSTTAMVSIIAANNEVGVIQKIREIGAICRENEVIFHTDAAQAIGNIEIDVNEMNIDMMSISSHKIYGPKGIGALYVNRGNSSIRLRPIINGGGQEYGIRSGTLSTPLCVGFGEACSLAKAEMKENVERILKLRNILLDKITSSLEEVYVNGDLIERLPGNLNVSFACVEGEALMMGLKEFAISSGSACTSASLEPSYVLKAIGVAEELSHTSLRISIGRYTTIDEINVFAERLIYEVNRLRNMSPLWEMIKEGVDIKSIKWGSH
ncbi:IscS subfamily cysteine desulfurase [Candidatus Gromoviella agglomerans]|uniref:IscS subfamily cysteine desulfurase n=1 Tax=Candidatus Gromoviella agglomerans TaxID=2806609 RepID=UPI001E329F5C|nr:IscS subfamily cysteine desulfurase [Candidatus Gromoviella agglomerans]UFX98520.1 Cysteine desulfurase [Candidatus Gromoviella agglomerans]